MKEVGKFFEGEKRPIILADVKPKLNREDEKRIRLDFVLPLTADTLDAAPEDVKDAFYAVNKDGRHLNPIGLTTEFESVECSFYATTETKTPQVELGGCTLRQLEVSRPKNKTVLEDGDVTLTFHLNAPATMELWRWCFHAYGAEMAVLFESLEPAQMKIKAADPDGANDGQGILEMEKSQPAPTTAPLITKAEQDAAFPDMPPEQRRSTKKIKVTKKPPKGKKK